MLLGKPLLDFFVAAEALRLGEPVFQCLHHIRWNRLLTRLWSRLPNFLELLKASFFVELKPVGHGIAMKVLR